MKFHFHKICNSEIQFSKKEIQTLVDIKIDGVQGSLTQRIHRVYGSLPESERKAADFILDSPGELAALAANELAEQVGISNATVSRFFRRLGFASFEAARRASRAMRASGSPLYLARTADGSRDGAAISKDLAAETQLIEMSLSMQNPLTMEAVAEAFAKARKVRVAGFRNSYFVASYACTTLTQFRRDVAMLNPAGQTLAESISELGPGDVVLVVGLRRRPKGFVEFIHALAATGADVVLLADRSIREAPAAARWNLRCAVEMPQLLDSYVGALAVMRLLALETMRHLGTEARRRLDDIESIHEALSELE